MAPNRFVLPALLFAPLTWAQGYDIALNNGRVIDPETGLDAIRHVGIRDGRIKALSEQPPSARRTLDVVGHTLAASHR